VHPHSHFFIMYRHLNCRFRAACCTLASPEWLRAPTQPFFLSCTGTLIVESELLAARSPHQNGSVHPHSPFSIMYRYLNCRVRAACCTLASPEWLRTPTQPFVRCVCYTSFSLSRSCLLHNRLTRMASCTHASQTPPIQVMTKKEWWSC